MKNIFFICNCHLAYFRVFQDKVVVLEYSYSKEIVSWRLLTNRALDDLINDSVFYCACVVEELSDDFHDDRYKNRLVENRLKEADWLSNLKEEIVRVDQQNVAITEETMQEDAKLEGTRTGWGSRVFG